MKQKRFAIGIAILVALTIMGFWGYGAFINANSKPAHPTSTASQPILEITYCGANPSGLCVVSFGVETENRMLFNFISPDLSFPDFYLKIRWHGGESIYECQRVKGFPTSIYCVGAQIPLGEKIELEVFSKTEGYLIAKGNLVISSLALPTPLSVLTPKISTTTTKTPTLQVPGSQTPSSQVTLTATAVNSYS